MQKIIAIAALGCLLYPCIYAQQSLLNLETSGHMIYTSIDEGLKKPR